MDKNKLPTLLSSIENGFEEVAQSLIMRANYIETGDVVMCRADVAARAGNLKSDSLDHDNNEIKMAIKRILSLTDEQQETIKKLRVMAEAFRSVR